MRKSRGSKYTISLNSEPRINFALNQGTKSCLARIPVFEPRTILKELSNVATAFLEETIEVDSENQVILLPKILEWYMADFAKTKLGLLRQLLKYLNKATWEEISHMLEMRDLKIKFKPYDWKYHSSFTKLQSLST